MNVPLSMLVTPSGTSILVRLLHSENAYFPMLVTPFGISILVRLLHSLNAPIPMLVIPSGISIFIKLLQASNAYSPILVIPSSIITFSITLVYLLLCQSIFLSNQSQFLISPFPDITNVLYSKVHVAITLPFWFFDTSHVSFSFIW